MMKKKNQPMAKKKFNLASEEYAKYLVDKIYENSTKEEAIKEIQHQLSYYLYMTEYELSKANAQHSTEWDYYGHMKEDKTIGLQEDWNQTLMTTINQVSAQIHKASLRGGANEIKIHSSKLPLFQTLAFYHDMVIGGRYMVKVDDDIPKNMIYVYNKEIYDCQLIPVRSESPKKMEEPLEEIQPITFGEGDNNEMSELSLKVIFSYTPEEIEKYKRGLVGYIEIKHGETVTGEPELKISENE